MLSTVQADFSAIAEKVKAGKRLDRQEGIRLFEADLFTLGALATEVRERLHGERAYYTHTLGLTYSNACVLSCGMCAFHRSLDHAGAYTLSLEQIEKRAEAAARAEVREFHITGALNSQLPLEYFVELLRTLKRAVPTATLKAFTSVEIDFFSKRFGLSVEELFTRFKAVGMDCMPGGGAEILSERVRSLLCPQKISAKRWLEVQALAHANGIPTNATMLYGHVETIPERIDHMLAIRALQDATAGIQAFVPLSYHSEGTAFADLAPTTGIEDLKVYAISRLMLDNVPHIKLLWTYVGIKMIQAALAFGVDDVGSTHLEERIVRAAGANHFDAPSVTELAQMIIQAGRIPKLVDSLYRNDSSTR